MRDSNAAHFVLLYDASWRDRIARRRKSWLDRRSRLSDPCSESSGALRIERQLQPRALEKPVKPKARWHDVRVRCCERGIRLWWSP